MYFWKRKMLLTVFLILKTNHSILILVGLILTLKLWLNRIEVLKVGNTVSWQLPSTTKREFGLLLRVPFLWTGSKMSNLLWSKIASDLKKDVANAMRQFSFPAKLLMILQDIWMHAQSHFSFWFHTTFPREDKAAFRNF